MKKILTASLVAMMAVTAANADIASTNFVKSQTGSDVAFKAGDFDGAAKTAANLKDAVNAIAGAVEGLNGSGANSVAGKIETLKEEVIGDLAEGKTVVQMIGDAQTTAKTEAIAAAKTETETQVGAAKTELGTTITNTAASTLSDAKAYADGLAGNYDTKGSAAAAETAAKAYADGLAGNYDTKGSAAAAETAAKAYADGLATNYDAAGSAAAAETRAKAYTDELKNGAVKENTDAISGINETLKSVATSDTVSDLTTRVGTAEGEIDALQAFQTDATADILVVSGVAETNKNNFNTFKLDVETNYAKSANVVSNQTFDDYKTAAETAYKGYTDGKIGDLDVTDTAVEKQFVTAVSEADGKVTVSRAALKATDIPTIEQSQVNGLGTALGAKQDTITDLATIRSGAQAGATALQAAAFETFKTANTAAIEAAEAKGQQGIDGAEAAKAVADAAMNWKSIKDATWTAAGCEGEGVVCSLVSKGGNIGWEKVVD